MIRVAIVEDDTPSREALSVLIDGAPDCQCVSASPSLEQALPMLIDAAPNVVLLDLNLPGIQGSDGVKLLRDRLPQAHVVILTVHSEQDRIFDCICNGAAGYLLKGTPPARLLDSIREACDGGAPMSPAIARKVIDLFRELPPRPAAFADLSPQEIRVLRLLAEGHGYVAIGGQLRISVNTVRNYIRSIYEKLHVHTKSEAVSKAIRAGLFR